MTNQSQISRDIHTGRWRATIRYIGTAFSGFQLQANQRTIQSELETILSQLDNQPVSLIGAGRTDSGVHAHAMTIAFDLARPMTAFKLFKALNGLCPDDIGVTHLQPAPDTFHPKRHAIGKCYVYRINHGVAKDPFTHHRAWHIHNKPDVVLMQKAAAYLIGEHDFESFRSTACQASHARRFLWSVRIIPHDSHCLIEVRGNAFCHNMVRIIAGSLIDVGSGRITVQQFEDGMAALDRTKMGKTAPAKGLCLHKVYYPDALDGAKIPVDATFPRWPITKRSWPFDNSTFDV